MWTLGILTETPQKSFSLAVDLGLINLERKTCNNCGALMNLEKGKKRHNIEGRWRCGKVVCRKSASIFENTIFHGSHVDISTILRLAYCWSQNYTIIESSLQCGVDEKTGGNWFKIFRRVVTCRVMNENVGKIGGVGCIVEVDETHIFKRKYNVGRLLQSESVWIVGGICRSTKKVFMKIVACRNKENLHRILIENVHSGSTIITDGWRGYWGIDNEGYSHLTVNHRYHFVDPVDRSIHTQHVERVWRSLKEVIPKGSRRDYLLEYVDEFIYKRELPTKRLLERFNRLVDTIKMFFS